MGKRRIRNLQYLKAGDIIGFDLRDDRRKEAEDKYGVKTFGKFDEAMRQTPDALVISTPPDLHVKYAMEAAKDNKHFFMEASVVDWGMDELIKECRGKEIVAAPSCTMRFQPSIKKMKEIVDRKDIGDALLLTHHCGQYLPDWHPWEDYHQFYVAKKATGAAKEIVSFELVWLTWVFGDIDVVSCLKGKLSTLDVDIDDAYQIVMKFRSKMLGHMLIDVISRVPERSCRIFGDEGIIHWDWGAGVKTYTTKDKQWKDYPEEAGTSVAGYAEKIVEEPYIEEMAAFVKAIKKESEYPYSLEEDKRVLDVLAAAEKSSDDETQIKTAR